MTFDAVAFVTGNAGRDVLSALMAGDGGGTGVKVVPAHAEDPFHSPSFEVGTDVTECVVSWGTLTLSPPVYFSCYYEESNNRYRFYVASDTDFTVKKGGTTYGTTSQSIDGKTVYYYTSISNVTAPVTTPEYTLNNPDLSTGAYIPWLMVYG